MKIRTSCSVVALLVLLGCSTPTEPYQSLETRLGEMFSAVSLSPPLYRSALEAGPLTQFRDGDRRVEANADAVVVGEVITVEAGRSYSWPDGPQEVGGPDTQVELAFNAKDAMISTVHVTMKVQQGVTADGVDLAGQQVTLGLSLASPVDVDGLSKELQGFGSVAVLLIDNSRSFFTYDPVVYGVLQYGAFLAPVVDGVATFPLSGLEEPTVRIVDLLQGRVEVPLMLDEAGEYQRTDDPVAVAEPQD